MELTKSANSLVSKIEALLAPQVKTLGYELLDLEYQQKGPDGGPVLRLFIENPKGTPIGFEDCMAVDHGLDPVIESPEFDILLPQGFALEVSSPGLDRPLKRAEDFVRFSGTRAKINTFRALTEAEMGNSKYFEHHQKQKNFFGTLRGFSEASIQLETDGQTFRIPFALVSKAHLDVSSAIDVNDANE